MHKIFTVKQFLVSLPMNQISMFTEEILLRLLAEDENQSKGQEDTTGLSSGTLIKSINSTMLRILENAPPVYIYYILLDLLIKYRR